MHSTCTGSGEDSALADLVGRVKRGRTTGAQDEMLSISKSSNSSALVRSKSLKNTNAPFGTKVAYASLDWKMANQCGHCQRVDAALERDARMAHVLGRRHLLIELKPESALPWVRHSFQKVWLSCADPRVASELVDHLEHGAVVLVRVHYFRALVERRAVGHALHGRVGRLL